MSRETPAAAERRSFFGYLNAGMASLAALAVGSAFAEEKSTGSVRWEAARHDKDDWLEKPAKHRLVFDTTSPEGFGQALAFAGNFIGINRSEYGLQTSDLAVLILARHQSTPFGYSDAIWAKYGTTIGATAKFDDPKSKLGPKTNVYNSADHGSLLRNMGMTLDSLSKQGVQVGVCSVATHRFAGAIAQATGANVDTIFTELTANLVNNSRMVPAGIVTLNRAQERGYSLVTV